MGDELAALFYGRLFEIDPSLRSLFRGDMQEQARQLMNMIGVAVGALGRHQEILPAVEELRRRHAEYVLREEYFMIVAAALLWTLNRALGEAFTTQVCDAWIAMYEAAPAALQAGAPVMTAAA
jgi:hemoglobin-like flavoprotein